MYIRYPVGKIQGQVQKVTILADVPLDELAKVWDLNDAKRLYTIALLRAAYSDSKNRDL